MAPACGLCPKPQTLNPGFAPACGLDPDPRARWAIAQDACAALRCAALRCAALCFAALRCAAPHQSDAGLRRTSAEQPASRDSGLASNERPAIWLLGFRELHPQLVDPAPLLQHGHFRRRAHHALRLARLPGLHRSVSLLCRAAGATSLRRRPPPLAPARASARAGRPAF